MIKGDETDRFFCKIVAVAEEISPSPGPVTRHMFNKRVQSVQTEQGFSTQMEALEYIVAKDRNILMRLTL